MQKTTPPTETTHEVFVLTIALIDTWRMPDFQNDLSENRKVRLAAEVMAKTQGHIQGEITLGVLRNDPLQERWIVDGRHRLHVFRLSGLAECLAEVRTQWFDTYDDMAAMYLILNSVFNKKSPDARLKAHERSNKHLERLRTGCPVIGYSNARHKGRGKQMISMSVVLRSWFMSKPEHPASYVPDVIDVARQLTITDTGHISEFLAICFAAWGNEKAYARFYRQLNVMLCMWLYRRMVLDTDRVGKRRNIMTNGDFKRCLIRLTSDEEYITWLGGRTAHKREHPVAYSKLCKAFVASLRQDSGYSKVILPRPDWATS